MITQINTD